MTSLPKLLLPIYYVNDATKHIRLAKSRVTLLCMIVADDASTDDLINALSEAAARGVTVEVSADILTYGTLGGFLLPTSFRKTQSKATSSMRKRFIKSGVKFRWLGGNRATFFSGRTHTKWCTVDDTVYSFGGVNLYQKGIDNNDYMFKIEDGALADKLVDEYHRLARADAGGYSYRSHSFMHGDDTILIDGGFFGDSIIYRRACQLASKASNVILVSQYCPTGKLAKLLTKTNCQLYFNPVANAQGVDRFVIRVGMFLSGHKTLYDKSRYLHAKFMIFDLPDGSRVALTGSHNFVNAGVLFGTREVALQTENPGTIKQLDDFLKRFIV